MALAASLLAAAVLAGIPATAQDATIESARISSAPSGGSTAQPVWIIDDPITVAVRYSAPLDEDATGTLDLELDEVGDGRGAKRAADCSVSDSNASTLECIYVVREGDEGSGVSIWARGGSLRGARLPRAALPEAAVSGSRADVDGVRVAIADGGVSVRILDGSGLDVSHKGAAAAGDTVEVTLAFVDGEEPYSPGFSLSLELDGGARPMLYVEDGDGRPTFRYKVVAGDNDRRFRLALVGADRLVDRNGNRGIAAGESEKVNERFLVGSVRRVDARGPRITDIRVQGAPDTGAYTSAEGKNEVTLVVAFDETVELRSGVSLDVLVGSGSGAAPRSAPCGDGRMPHQLNCTLTVLPGWDDADGIATPANPLAFGEGDIEDEYGNPAENRFSAQRFPDQRIDTTPPEAVRVSVRAPRSSSFAVGDTIDATVTFTEEVRRASAGLLLTVEDEDGRGGLAFELLRARGNALEYRYTLTPVDLRSGPLGRSLVGSYGLVGTLTALDMVEDVHGNSGSFELPASSASAVSLRLAGTLDVTIPRLESIFLQNAKGSYKEGDPIEFGAIFSERVTADAVQLAFTIGGKSKTAMLSPDNSFPSSLVTFTYRVESGDFGRIAVSGIERTASATRHFIIDGDGVSGGNGYWLQRGIVQRCALGVGVDPPSCVPKDLPRRSLTGAATVDSTPPTVESLAFLSSPAPQSTGAADGRKYYGEGETIAIQVTMSEKVALDGIPAALTLTVGVSDRQAIFAELRGGTNLVFEYTVEPEDRDRNGVEAKLACQFHNVVKDLAGNPWQEGNTDFDDFIICSDRVFLGRTVTSAAHRVDGSIIASESAAPPVDDVREPIAAIASDASASPPGHYRAADEIVIKVDLSPPVSFDRRPVLRFEFDTGGSGCGSVASDEAPAKDVTRLTFRCSVEPGDEDRDGIVATLSGALVTADGVTAATLSLRLSEPLLVDARDPVLERLAIESSGPYRAGDQIVVRATFSEPVTAGDGASVPLDVGGLARSAALRAAPRSPVLEFRYTVMAGDADDDGVVIPALTAAGLGAAIVDAAGNEADIDHAGVAGGARQAVDTIAPRVESIRVATPARAYGEGDRIVFEVTFTEAVEAGSGAALTVTIGDAERELAREGSASGLAIAFAYRVAAGDRGAVSVPADPLAGAFADAAGNAAVLAHAGRTFQGVAVDTLAPSLVATGALAVTSRPTRAETYAVGETIEVTATFDEDVVVTGSPRLTLTVGERRRQASHAPGGSANAVLFRYEVAPGDTDGDGVSIAANALRLPDGAGIADASGLAADIRNEALADQPGHKVDGVAPRVRGAPAIASRPASGDAYLAGETIELRVAFTEPVSAGADAALALRIGADSVVASCRGATAAWLACRYTVRAGDFDGDGIGVAANALSGAVTDLAGNGARLDHPALADDAAHKVYAAPPEATGAVADLALVAGGEVETVRVAGAFTGAALRLAASSSDPAVARVALSGAALEVRSGFEGRAEVTVTATNPAGSASLTFAVLVTTDANEVAAVTGALATIGRGMLSSATAIIGGRFELAPAGGASPAGGAPPGVEPSARGSARGRPSLEEPSARGSARGRPSLEEPSAGDSGATLAVGGRSVMPRAMPGDGRWRQGALHERRPVLRRHVGGAGVRENWLSGSSFAMPLRARGGNVAVGVWGAADAQRLESDPDSGVSDVSTSSGWLGVDARGDRWLVGTAFSRSTAEADYDFRGAVEGDGRLETQLTGFHPYGRFELGEDTRLWLLGGLGSGDAELTRTHIGRLETADLGLAMIAGGLQRELRLALAGASFSLKGDAGFLHMEADEGIGAAAGLAASVSRLRLALAAAWEIGIARPFAEVGGRFDGGDGETGGGVEVAGGVRLANVAGFGLEAKGRILAVHSVEGYRESGVSVTASFDAGAPGRGITFRLSPRWGGAADSTDLLWSDAVSPGRAGPGAGMHVRHSWGVEGALGYGFDVGAVPGLFTPFGEMHVAGEDNARRMRVGVRYALPVDGLRSARVEAFAEGADVGGGRASETRAMLIVEARF